MRRYRLVSDLSAHECEELEEDFAINLVGCHAVMALTKEEWKKIRGWK